MEVIVMHNIQLIQVIPSYNIGTDRPQTQTQQKTI